MEDNNRTFIEVENLNGEVEKVEVFAEVKSERDNKIYLLLTPDETIGDTVNMAIGYIYEDDETSTLTILEDEEEYKYVYSLINKALKEG